MKIDEQMSLASRLGMEGLVLFDGDQKQAGLQKLSEGMRIAQECFYSLGPGSFIRQEARKERDLLDQGALATKITGAGGGGMIVALWGE